MCSRQLEQYVRRPNNKSPVKAFELFFLTEKKKKGRREEAGPASCGLCSRTGSALGTLGFNAL